MRYNAVLNDLQNLTLWCFLLILIGALVYCSTYPFKQPEFEQKAHYKEANYINA